MILGMRGSHVTTFLVLVVTDRAIFEYLSLVALLSVLLLWVLPYLYPPRQGGLVWGTLLASRLATGRG